MSVYRPMRWANAHRTAWARAAALIALPALVLAALLWAPSAGDAAAPSLSRHAPAVLSATASPSHASLATARLRHRDANGRIRSSRAEVLASTPGAAIAPSAGWSDVTTHAADALAAQPDQQIRPRGPPLLLQR